MATTKKRINYHDSDEGLAIRQALYKMVADETYTTDASYSANLENYPDNLIPFVEKHLQYLNTHQNVDPQHYLANLRLMTRVR